MSGSLNHSPADILYHLFEDEGVVGTMDPDWPGYVNNSPSDQLPNVIISDVTGTIRGKAHPISQTVEHYGIQIRTRAEQNVSFRKANEILTFLDNIHRRVLPIEMSEYMIDAVTPTSGVIRVGKEQPGDYLFIYSLNVSASIQMKE
jgi:hypothetical protein